MRHLSLFHVELRESGSSSLPREFLSVLDAEVLLVRRDSDLLRVDVAHWGRRIGLSLVPFDLRRGLLVACELLHDVQYLRGSVFLHGNGCPLIGELRVESRRLPLLLGRKVVVLGKGTVLEDVFLNLEFMLNEVLAGTTAPPHTATFRTDVFSLGDLLSHRMADLQTFFGEEGFVRLTDSSFLLMNLCLVIRILLQNSSLMSILLARNVISSPLLLSNSRFFR